MGDEGWYYELILTTGKTRLSREEMCLWLQTSGENSRDVAHLRGSMGYMPLGVCNL